MSISESAAAGASAVLEVATFFEEERGDEPKHEVLETP